MSEKLLSDSALSQELQAVKATAELLATQKLRYSHSYVPPVENRSRKPTLVNVPVVEPPTTSTGDDDEAGPSNDSISLTIKSLKPPLSFTLSARPTSTISDLKSQLAKAESGAPPAEAQRWILRGKAMGDSKLLKEFPVEEGSTINLMITKTASPAPTPSPSGAEDPSDSPAVPSLTLSEPAAAPSSSSTPATPQISLQTDLDNLPLSTTSSTTENPASTHPGLSDTFLSTVSGVELWNDVREVCEKRFGKDSNEAQKAWEAMFSGAREWISPNQKALVREQVGFSAMGGF